MSINVREKLMKNYEAIKNLSNEDLEEFLDQVFLAGFNSGYQSLVDPAVDDVSPFNANWLNAEVEENPSLVKDETGERLIIEPLATIAMRMTEFDIKKLCS